MCFWKKKNSNPIWRASMQISLSTFIRHETYCNTDDSSMSCTASTCCSSSWVLTHRWPSALHLGSHKSYPFLYLTYLFPRVWIFYLEAVGRRFLRNINIYLPVYTTFEKTVTFNKINDSFSDNVTRGGVSAMTVKVCVEKCDPSAAQQNAYLR
jgi:hypothetical protein